MDAVPYGLWQSPISAQLASASAVAFQDVVIDNDDVYWSEMRPQESGRYVIVKHSKGQNTDVLPAPYNARTRVHEYGGAAFTVYQGDIYFIHFQDQRIYKLEPNQKPQAITAEGTRFAELHATPLGIIAIAEQHRDNQVENFIAKVDMKSGDIQKMAHGYDFYAQIALTKDFKQIAYTCWNHPNMPWDNTELWIGALEQNAITNTRQVDKAYKEQAFFAPKWGPDNQLVVVSDKSNWWNLYRVEGDVLKQLFAVESEIGQPLWQLGASTWGFYQDGILCTFVQNGKGRLFKYKSTLQEIETPYTHFSQIRISPQKAAMIASAPDKPYAVVVLEGHTLKVLRENTATKIDKGYLSIPEHITFDSQNRKAHAFFYRPQNKDFKAPEGTLPPLIVRSHGGPTANSGAAYNLEIQFWTSRGFAYVDVNYAGSTGYGRTYRKSLEENWGIFDVQDCEAAAQYLAKKGLVNSKQFAITGGSAGGYTTLAALAFTKTFHVGASHYGVSELEALAKETHKFESHYLDRLIGPYPKEKARYQARSPLHHIAGFSAPIIFFQGEEDKIVLPNQAEMMIAALKEKGIKTAYFLFPGEQHGFRKAENKITVLNEQYRFFIDALGIKQ